MSESYNWSNNWPLDDYTGISRGVISGCVLEAACLWIGRIPSSEGNTYNRVDVPEHEIPTEFNHGEFYFPHVYGGSSCKRVSLHGIFLPIETCSNREVVRALNDLRKLYSDVPFVSVEPNLDEILKIRDVIRVISPLDMTSHFRRAGEAYLPFAFDERTYQWLKMNFKLARIVLSSQTKHLPVKIPAVDDLPWMTALGFTNWLFNYPVNPLDSEEAMKTLVIGAFIYPNSDLCDG